MAEPRGSFDERDHGLVMGNGRVAVMDEPARRRLETDRAGGDREVAQAHLGLERAARANADERGSSRDREDLSDRDLDVVGPDARGDDRDREAAVRSRGGCELAVLVFAVDVVEPLRDLGRSFGIAGEEDVLGQLSGAESDVILPLPRGERDAVVRARQAPISSSILYSREARSSVDVASNERQAESRSILGRLPIGRKASSRATTTARTRRRS